MITLAVFVLSAVTIAWALASSARALARPASSHPEQEK